MDRPEGSAAVRRHWRRVLTLTGVLLVAWFVAGPVLGILAAEPLNRLRLGGVPLGFWFAQQGSIILFVLIILVYALAMNSLEKRFRRERDAEGRP